MKIKEFLQQPKVKLEYFFKIIAIIFIFYGIFTQNRVLIVLGFIAFVYQKYVRTQRIGKFQFLVWGRDWENEKIKELITDKRHLIGWALTTFVLILVLYFFGINLYTPFYKAIIVYLTISIVDIIKHVYELQ